MFADIPSSLRAADFVLVRFDLEFQESCVMGPESILRLRRDLHNTGRQVLGEGEGFLHLFDPPLPTDPSALRRHQRPGPPFVLHPPEGLPGSFAPGDILTLPAVFLGAGIQRLPDFLRVLRQLGKQGLCRGEGRFELATVEAEDAAGSLQPLWREGKPLGELAPPLLDVYGWLEANLPAAPVILEFITPARLIAGGRPLFRGTFGRVFPFLLRRVTSMLHAHCSLEVVDDPALLLEASARVVEAENCLVWRDWRVLEGPEARVDLGGLVGCMRLEGEDLGEILWLLGLASLLNIGRGAAYAAGHVALRALPV